MDTAERSASPANTVSVNGSVTIGSVIGSGSEDDPAVVDAAAAAGSDDAAVDAVDAVDDASACVADDCAAVVVAAAAAFDAVVCVDALLPPHDAIIDIISSAAITITSFCLMPIAPFDLLDPLDLLVSFDPFNSFNSSNSFNSFNSFAPFSPFVRPVSFSFMCLAPFNFLELLRNFNGFDELFWILTRYKK